MVNPKDKLIMSVGCKVKEQDYNDLIQIARGCRITTAKLIRIILLDYLAKNAI